MKLCSFHRFLSGLCIANILLVNSFSKLTIQNSRLYRYIVGWDMSKLFLSQVLETFEYSLDGFEVIFEVQWISTIDRCSD